VLTLMDHETPLWLDPAADAARAWITFHTGAPLTGDPARAMFALSLSLTDLTPSRGEGDSPGQAACPGLFRPPIPGQTGADKPGQDSGEGPGEADSTRASAKGVATGTDETPESSATIILQVASLTTGRAFLLEGPGLREPKLLAVDGLPADFVETWQRNHALFPRGIDLILCAGSQIAALPRSVSLREA
jgi:alpha-D-ribose 1-methylphosphonate 5-triphosphate synthase subunit PhnH